MRKLLSRPRPNQLSAVASPKNWAVYVIVISPHQLIQPDDKDRNENRTVSVLINTPCRKSHKPFQKRPPDPIEDKLPIRSFIPFDFSIPRKGLQVVDILQR